MIASCASLTDTGNLCNVIDAHAPDAISSILLMDADGKRLWPAAGSRVPKAYAEAISPVPIGPLRRVMRHGCIF